MELGDETPTALYRLYDAEGKLLYIGITGDIKARFAQHAETKAWWPDVTRKTVEWHAARSEASQAELEAIKAERPVHNIAGAALVSGGVAFDLSDLRAKVSGEEVFELAQTEMRPMSLRLALLELVGVPTGTALDLLGVSRSDRYKVIKDRKRSEVRPSAA
jgi:predicted GIY-YIG superfamily endonuclease